MTSDFGGMVGQFIRRERPLGKKKQKQKHDFIYNVVCVSGVGGDSMKIFTGPFDGLGYCCSVK